QLDFYTGQPAVALTRYARLLAEGPDSAHLRLERGRTLLALGRATEAEQDLAHALTADPSLSDAYLALSKLALAASDVPAARRNSDLALALAESGETLFQAGQVAEARGETSAAVATYEAAFERAVNPAPTEPDRYATEVARRRPLPLTYLPCLIQLYPDPLLTAITQAQARLLEQQGQLDRAAELYDRLRRYVPAPASQP
ncbi:MAG: tetratricopeptide repeat protein, partial [Anaerolineae bacterium]|nr:tetratricopeptide repeat protein [Anaerolineae bacterium]